MEKQASTMTRRTFAKAAAVGAAALSLGGLMAGCADGGSGDADGKSAPAASEKPDTLTIYVGAEPEDGFDPLTGWGYNGSYILFQSRLLRFDKDLNLQPDLAAEWSVSDDGVTYTYKLREGVKFSDGSDLTADDVVFSYLTARDSGASMLDLTKLKDARALDAATVEFTLEEPYSSFASLTGKLGIVPKALYDEQSYRQNPVGSGPFKLLQWDAGQQIIIAPNEHYYGTMSPFKQITLLFLDGETALSNAQSGKLDVVMVQPEYAKSIVEGMDLLTYPTIDTRGFNLPMEPLSTNAEGKEVGSNVTCDKAVRKALSIGISRQAIVDNALNGVGTPTTALITQVPWANEACVYEDDRLDEAKKLLDDAGWIEGDDGIRVKDGQRAEFSITGRTDDLQRYNVAVAFAQEAEKLGIKINASSALWSECKDKAATIPTCWGTGDYDPSGDLCGYYRTYEEGAGTNYSQYSQYSNEVVDGHVHDALATTDMEAALESWKKVQWDGTTGPESEDGDMPNIWLVTIDHPYFVRSGLDLGEQLVHPHGHGWPVVENLNEWKWA